MATTTSSPAPWNPFLGLPISPHLHLPLYQINDHVHVGPTSTQSLTITHLAFNPITQRFIYALRISGPPARNAPATLHITASEELLHKLPDLVADYGSTDEDGGEEEPPSNGSSKRQRLCENQRPQPHSSSCSPTTTTPRKPIWISGTDTRIQIGDRAKANDGSHTWEGTIRSLADPRHGWLTATTRNCTVRAFAAGDVLIKREGWVDE